MKKILFAFLATIPFTIKSQDVKLETSIGNSIVTTSNFKTNALTKATFGGGEFVIKPTWNLNSLIGIQTTNFSYSPKVDSSIFTIKRYITLVFGIKKYCFRQKSTSVYLEFGFCGSYNYQDVNQIFVNGTNTKVRVQQTGGNIAYRGSLGCRTKLDRNVDIDISINQQNDIFSFQKQKINKVTNDRTMLSISVIRKFKK